MSRLIRPTLLAHLTIALTGCTSWVPIQQPFPDYAAERPGTTLRLSFKNGTQVKLDSVVAARDSVIGVISGGGERIAVPLSDVTLVERSRTDAGATAGAVLLGAAFLALVLGAQQLFLEQSLEP